MPGIVASSKHTLNRFYIANVLKDSHIPVADLKNDLRYFTAIRKLTKELLPYDVMGNWTSQTTSKIDKVYKETRRVIETLSYAQILYRSRVLFRKSNLTC